ncbi:MAG: hypothetical protein J6K88_04230 [Oscillospiraceae bacterium]|nr:hypothetical protein [Oscillospiraceae bacterium]
MKKLLFGIALILFSIFFVVYDVSYDLPVIVDSIYIFAPLIGLGFCFMGLFEKEE